MFDQIDGECMNLSVYCLVFIQNLDSCRLKNTEQSDTITEFVCLFVFLYDCFIVPFVLHMKNPDIPV